MVDATVFIKIQFCFSFVFRKLNTILVQCCSFKWHFEESGEELSLRLAFLIYLTRPKN